MPVKAPYRSGASYPLSGGLDCGPHAGFAPKGANPFQFCTRLRRLGLTVPDTVDLLDRLRREGLEVPLDALSVEDCAAAIAETVRS